MRGSGYLVTMASWLSKVTGIFRRGQRAAPTGSAVDVSQLENGIMRSSLGRGPPPRGTRELVRSYREQPWLRAVASRIARGVAATEWRVFARASEPLKNDGRLAPPWRWGRDRVVRDAALRGLHRDNRQRHLVRLLKAGLLREVVDHPMLDLLANPNDMMTGDVALKVTQIWLDIKGEAFWLVAFNADGTPGSLYPVPPHWVTAVPTTEAPYFVISAGGLQMRIEQRAVVWLRDVDPENPYGRGTGVAESLGDELETDEYAAKYLKSWFFNSAAPSLIVAFEGATGPQLKEARELWERTHRGVHNAHRTHFASGKMNAQKLDTAFREQQLVELRRMERDTVIQVFNVPPECVGIIENSNRATIDAASYMYAVGVEHPRIEFLRIQVSSQLMPLYPGSEYALLEATLSVPEDLSRRLEVMKAQPTAFELNEWRTEAGYEPHPELTGQFPAGMPGQQPSAEVEDEKPELPEDEEAVIVDEARGDPPWVKHLR